jgi:hypothetical protein
LLRCVATALFSFSIVRLSDAHHPVDYELPRCASYPEEKAR